MASKQFSKILLPSNTEKVLFYFHLFVHGAAAAFNLQLLCVH